MKWAGPRVTELRQLIWNTESRICHLCHKPIASYREMELDHVIPKSKGGALFDPRNLRMAHGRFSQSKCNTRRQAKTIAQYQSTMTVDNTEWFGI